MEGASTKANLIKISTHNVLKYCYKSQFSSLGQFDHPHGIGLDSKGNIYINTLNEPRIQKFTNDGKFIKEWGSNGTTPGN